MTASLLSLLGLPSPAGVPPGPVSGLPKQPTGPIHAPGVEPREELPARRAPPTQGKGTSRPQGNGTSQPQGNGTSQPQGNGTSQPQGHGTSQPQGGSVPTTLQMPQRDPIGTGGLPPNLRPKNPDDPKPPKPAEPTDAEIANAKAAFEKTKLKGAEQLAAVVARIGEKQRRDPLVAVLRDGLSKVQPFTSDAKFKEGLHSALDELASKGLEKGFIKLIELAVGKEAGKVERPDTSVPPTGTKPDEAPGEHIATKDFEVGEAKGRARFVFDGAPPRVPPGEPMLFKVWTPERWSLKDKRWDNTRVVVKAKEGGTKGTALPSAPFRRKGANDVKMKAPDVPGVYVLYIEAAGIPETSPEHDFKVAP